jgi:PEP-CTERM motif
MRKLHLLFLILSMGLSLPASTVYVISQGDNPSSFTQSLMGSGFREYAEVGWTTGSTAYSNVTITAMLIGLDSGGDTFDAFLSNTIGSGATTEAEADGLTASDSGFAMVTLFSGLNLTANTDYFLTIAPEAGQMQWAVDATFAGSFTQPAMLLDTGVVFIKPPGFCTDDSGDCNDPAPTSGFQDAGLIPIFSVTSDTSSVPEPSTLVLAAAGIAAGFVRSRRPRR